MNALSPAELPVLPTIGERVAWARKQHTPPMIQADLALPLGLSRAAIAQWEINATSPTIAKCEEAARLLGVPEQWLAFGTRPGDARIVYRSPQRDGIEWAPYIEFGESPDEWEETTHFAFPSEILSSEFRANPDSVVVLHVNSMAAQPRYDYGDLVIVDISDKRPTPGGVNLYWDGAGPAFGMFTVVPGKPPKVRLAVPGSTSITMEMDEIPFIGRVVGRIQKP